MRGIARKLFMKPKVLFMLMVICLHSPLQTFQAIQSIQACPDNCDLERTVVADAEDEVAVAYKAWQKALRELNEALDELEIKREAYNDALKAANIAEKLAKAAAIALAAADLALLNAIRLKETASIIVLSLTVLGLMLALDAAIDDLDLKIKAVHQALLQKWLAEAEVDSCDAALTAATAVLNAKNVALDGAQAALAYCESCME